MAEGVKEFGLIEDKVAHVKGRNPNFKTPACRIFIYSSQGIEYDELRTSGVAGLAKLPDPESLEQLYAIVGRDGYRFYDITNEGTYNKLESPEAINWHVLDCRVNLTRQWNCSSASFQLAEYQPDPSKRSIPPIAPNDVIVIKMGYASSPFIPVHKQGQPAVEDPNRYWYDTVFYGIVDSVVSRGGSSENDGVVFSVKARDAMKLLSDTRITRVFNYEASESTSKTIKSIRSQYVEDLIYAGSLVSNFKQSQPTQAQTGDTAPQGSGGEKIQDISQSELVEISKEGSYYRNVFVKNSTRQDDISLESNIGMFGASVIDKFPLQIIKFISSQEGVPTEIWANHRTGEIYWQQRVTDARCLAQDPALRQYVYTYPQNHANVLSFQNEWSSIGVVTQHIIQNPINNLDAQNVSSGYVAISPWSVLVDNHNNGRKLRPMTSTRYIFDSALKSSGSDTDNERTALGIALATIYGRCIESGTIQIEGDPTLEVGEAIQFYNAGLLGKFASELDSAEKIKSVINPGTNPPQGAITGIYRVEALSHLFAVGGVKRGYTTSFIFGPLGSLGNLIQDDNGLQTQAPAQKQEEQPH